MEETNIVSDFVSWQSLARSFVHKTLSHLNAVASIGNCDMKSATVKCCFIYNFISTLDDVAELETMWWNLNWEYSLSFIVTFKIFCWKMCCNIGPWVRNHLLRETWPNLLGVPPGWGVKGFRVSLTPPPRTDRQSLCSLPPWLHRGTYIYTHQYLNTKQYNIRWHTSLQHILCFTV
jgi:hypothetical protein